jgi:hypothetical protein
LRKKSPRILVVSFGHANAEAEATELQFFIQGKLNDSAPLSCSLELAKRIAQETIDRIIAENPHWRAAENRRCATVLSGAERERRGDAVNRSHSPSLDP